MMQNLIVKISGYIRKAETYLLVLVLSTMIGLSTLQIILRSFFKAVSWFDTVINFSVLWAAMIAGGIVTYEANHIKIDIAGRFTKGKLKELIYTFTSFFAGAVSSIFMVLFLVYIVVVEYYAKLQSPGGPGFAYLFLLILPLGFLMIAGRFYNTMLSYNYDLTGKRVMSIGFSAVQLSFSFSIMVIMLVYMKGFDPAGVFSAFIGSKIYALGILSGALFVLLAGGISMYFSIKSEKPGIVYSLSPVSGVFFSILFVLSVIRITGLTLISKINGGIIPFTETQMNLLFGIPVLCYLLAHYAFFYPVSDYLLAIYPRPDHESGEEASL